MSKDQMKSSRQAKKPKKSAEKKSTARRKSELMCGNLTASASRGRQTGDADTASMLFLHVPVLRSYALCLVRNATDADDLVQDCLVRALSKIHLFKPGTNLKAWLLAIIHNIFLDDTRRSKRTYEFVKAVTLTAQGSVTRPNQLHWIELTDADKALAALPEAQRSTLLLSVLDGLNYEETAKVSRVPVGTVRSRLSRGRSSLKAMVQGITLVDDHAFARKDADMSISRVA